MKRAEFELEQTKFLSKNLVKPYPTNGEEYTLNSFKKEKVIGEGTYGKVILCSLRDVEAPDSFEGKYKALKSLKLQSESEGFPITALREIQILNLLKNHHNVVKLEQVITKNATVLERTSSG